jgi:hypothetical protein
MKVFCGASGVQQGINVLHFQVNSVAAPGVTDQDMATSMDAALAAPYKAYLPTSCEYLGLRVQIIRPNLKPAVIAIGNRGIGTEASDQLPSQATLLLSPRTAVAGRKGRGRCFLPFWGKAASTIAGGPTGAAVALAQTVSNILYGARVLNAGAFACNIIPVLVSRNAPLTQIPVTSVLIRTAWATQRRRSKINKPDVFGP